MFIIDARNVNHALYQGAQMLRRHGVEQPSRNGPVLRAPGPVTTVYDRPIERVMLYPGRDANPFFHLIEALWMLAGRHDLAALTPYVKTMGNFSDDGGKTQPGAYGKRWRSWFTDLTTDDLMDQLDWAVKRLKADPNDRRVVIQMYDAPYDQSRTDHGGRDIPCNLIALPTVGTDGRLDLTVFNRSNDMVWGAYGANAVHFSVLQEVIAGLVGVPVGRYWQVSNNFHGYLDTMGKAGKEWPWNRDASDPRRAGDPYETKEVTPYPLGMFPEQSLEEITDDIEMFFKEPARVGIRSKFLRRVACPMVMAHRAYQVQKGFEGTDAARQILAQMPAGNDWYAGAMLWFNNREAKLRKAADDGVHP